MKAQKIYVHKKCRGSGAGASITTNVCRNCFKEFENSGAMYNYCTESYDRIHPHGLAPSGRTAMPFDMAK